MGAADVESPLKQRSMKIQMKKKKGDGWFTSLEGFLDISPLNHLYFDISTPNLFILILVPKIDLIC